MAAIALTEDHLLDGTFELSGDGGRNREELAAIASKASGRAIEAASPGFEEWAAKADLPYNAAQKQQLAAMYAHYDQHGLPGNPFTLRAILGRKPRSLNAFFADLTAGTPTTIT